MKGQKNLERQQNKVRGALGISRQKGKEALNRDLLLRSELRRVMLGARTDLGRLDRFPFFDWLEKLGDSQALGLSTPLLSDLTSSSVRANSLSVASELEWVGFRLRPYIEQLRRFQKTATDLNSAVWADDWPKVRNILDRLRADFGASLWLISAEISLRQQFEGLESQKGYVNEIRDEYPAGIPAYIAFYVSVRNEQRSTYSLFSEDYSSRLAESKMIPKLQSYLSYKILGDFIYSEDSFSNVLMHEQTQSIYDIYETTIDLLQRAVIQATEARWSGIALALLDAWKPIQDPRVDKLRFALGGRVEPAKDQPLEGRSGFSAWLPSDLWKAVWPLIEGSDAPGRSEKNDDALAHRAAALLRSVLWRDEDFEESRGRLLKFARNFSFSPSASALGDLTRFLTLGVQNDNRTLGYIALKSRSFSTGDLLYVRSEKLTEAAKFLSGSISPAEVVRWITCGEPDERPQVAPIPWYLASLRLRAVDVQEALAAVEAISDGSLNEPQRVLRSNLRIQLKIEDRDLDAAIALMAREIAHTPSVSSIMPSLEAVGGRDWDSLVRVPDKLDLAIVLYSYWKQTDESLYATYLRFAFEEVLNQLGVALPSGIDTDLTKSCDRLIFFQAHICIPVVMDTSGLFVSSDELLDERLKILRNLGKADQRNAEPYSEEKALLRANKLIKSGLQIVDSNRVNVDTSALTRWATKRYQESYLRYLALTEAGIGISAKFDDILAVLATVSDATGEFFTIPESEADTLLLEIILSIRTQFLEDPQYGLEYFLGKRIRHGSLAGHMRGPVEAARLITERRSPTAPYERNEDWLGALTFDDAPAKESAAAAFDRFSDEYDKLIADTRDRRLHVRSKTHPDGIFRGIILPPQYHLLKSVATKDLDFEGFLAICINLMWAVLDESLNDAKHLLSTDVKEQAVQLFAQLQAGLRDSASADENLGMTLAHIQTTSTEVQRQLDAVANWFERVETRQAGHLFSIGELIEVAVRSALNTLTTFDPEIEQQVDGDLKANASVLVVLADIVFVVLDNVYRRARVGNSPKISVVCAIDEANSALSLRLVNPISDALDPEAIEGKLATTRSKIAAGDIVKGAGADRDSGLLKLAALARHYPSAELDFGLLDDLMFETKIRLPINIVSDRFTLTMPESQ